MLRQSEPHRATICQSTSQWQYQCHRHHDLFQEGQSAKQFRGKIRGQAVRGDTAYHGYDGVDSGVDGSSDNDYRAERVIMIERYCALLHVEDLFFEDELNMSSSKEEKVISQKKFLITSRMIFDLNFL